MRMDAALEALAGALAAADVALWKAPQSLAGLEALEAELAPMRLPDAVREFWTRVDVPTLRVAPYPGFATPELALTSWRAARDEFAAWEPLALVYVAYES